MSGLSLGEVVEKLKEAKTKNERVKLLKENDCAALRGIIRMNFDSSLVLSLPKGRPPYRKLDVPNGFGETTLKASASGWYVFVKELSPNLRQSKRESIFIQLLESLDQREAEILLSAKDRELDLGITKKVVSEVFPDLIKFESNKNGIKKESTKNTSDTPSGDGKSV